jgi:hypothetical protein
VVGITMAVGGSDLLDAADKVSLRIHQSSERPPTNMLYAGEGSRSSHAGSVEADQSVAGIVMAAGGGAGLDAAAQVDTATREKKSRNFREISRNFVRFVGPRNFCISFKKNRYV